MTVEAVRVLLVDDQDLVRSGLQRILRPKDGFVVVCECTDGEEVEGAVSAHDPDVVVMDLRMRRVDGIGATRRIRRHSDPPAVLALTTFDDDELLSGASRRCGRFPAQGLLGRGTDPRSSHRRPRQRLPRPGRHGARARDLPRHAGRRAAAAGRHPDRSL